jgi:hypothetical protein
MGFRNLFPPKVGTDTFISHLSNLVSVLLANAKIDRILVLVDASHTDRFAGQGVQLPLCTFATPADITPEFLAQFNPRRSHVLYGVECSSDGLPAMEKIVAAGFKFSPFGGAPVGSYAYDNSAALATVVRQFVAQTMAGYAKFEDPGSKEDFINLCQALETTRDVPGAVVEIGCFRGSSSSVMLDYAKHTGLDRQFYFFDTFDGFSYEEARASADAMWQGTHATEGQAVVQSRLEAVGYPKLRVLKANIITDDLPAEIGPIAVANVDVDLYEAVAAGLRKVADRIPSGGIIICEDAGHTPALIGARLALLEFMRSPQGKRFTQVFLASGQAFLIAHTAPPS